MPEYEVRATFPRDLDATVRAYLECAEWCDVFDCCECGTFGCSTHREPTDRGRLEAWDGSVEWDAASLASAVETVRDFYQANADDIAAGDISESQVGHDLWLTRNGHGCGFWERGDDIGRRLTANAEPYGAAYVSVGAMPDDEDGTLYLSLS